MYKKFNQLSFVIGLFFFLVSLILFIHILMSDVGLRMNFHTAVVFLIFGLAMMIVKNPSSDKPGNNEQNIGS